MQLEITLKATEARDYSARDLGYLLHKHPDHLHRRDTAQGTVSIFYPLVSEDETRAVLYLDVDPVALVRGKGPNVQGLLAQYVNDRPYVANSFLSVAMARALGQTMSGKSKERQALADRPLPFTVRVAPVAVSGGQEVIDALFAPLGYRIEAQSLDESGQRAIFDLRVSGEARLADLLTHLYVLVPVLDNAKHYFIDRGEIDKLLEKGGDWLAGHPAKDLITKRALKYRRALVAEALDRLAEECDAVTYEFENVPVDAVRYLAGKVKIFPGPGALEVA
ncbi:MAG: 3' terminal RNA ribose 2'-O-methyltransferase Hen1, partial [Pseudomonadota bacterium]